MQRVCAGPTGLPDGSAGARPSCFIGDRTSSHAPSFPLCVSQRTVFAAYSFRIALFCKKNAKGNDTCNMKTPYRPFFKEGTAISFGRPSLSSSAVDTHWRWKHLGRCRHPLGRAASSNAALLRSCFKAQLYLLPTYNNRTSATLCGQAAPSRPSPEQYAPCRVRTSGMLDLCLSQLPPTSTWRYSMHYIGS